MKIEDVTGQVVNEQRSFRICRNILSDRLSSGEEGGGGSKEGHSDGQGTSLAQLPTTVWAELETKPSFVSLIPGKMGSKFQIPNYYLLRTFWNQLYL